MNELRSRVDWVCISADPLGTEALITFVGDENAGAIDVFIGTTRRWTGDRETTDLAYEAFTEMALRQMQRLLDAARDRFQIIRGAIHHRIGVVPVGEASVIIAVSTAHRAQSIDACRFVIDTLKADVPIWKREVYADGTTEWVEPKSGEDAVR